MGFKRQPEECFILYSRNINGVLLKEKKPYSINGLTLIKETATRYKNVSKLSVNMKCEFYIIPDIKYATS